MTHRDNERAGSAADKMAEALESAMALGWDDIIPRGHQLRAWEKTVEEYRAQAAQPASTEGGEVVEEAMRLLTLVDAFPSGLNQMNAIAALRAFLKLNLRPEAHNNSAPAGECFNAGLICARCGHHESLAAPAPAHGWRPIEEMPEECVALVYMPHEHRKFQVMYRQPEVTVIGGAFGFDLTKPTHFMELPEAPK